MRQGAAWPEISFSSEPPQRPQEEKRDHSRLSAAVQVSTVCLSYQFRKWRQYRQLALPVRLLWSSVQKLTPSCSFAKNTLKATGYSSYYTPFDINHY